MLVSVLSVALKISKLKESHWIRSNDYGGKVKLSLSPHREGNFV
jgi:hypothetical protein